MIFTKNRRCEEDVRIISHTQATWVVYAVFIKSTLVVLVGTASGGGHRKLYRLKFEFQKPLRGNEPHSKRKRYYSMAIIYKRKLYIHLVFKSENKTRKNLHNSLEVRMVCSNRLSIHTLNNFI